ncbi:uncharacterized protein LOC135076710 [Ostrinia nubilalis]|uniref:uncharacterized protein LOC135076710 n=1 Tax=Ostrinia nubilalis TaxID=29057 RepID=UPI00308249AB
MTLIEGIGDEVIQFVGVLLVATVATLAWLSTNARPGRYRTVVVMRPRPHHPVTVSFRTRASFMIANTPVSISQQASTAETIVTPGAIEDSRDASRVIPLQEMDSIIDADMAMMNNNRLHFYRRLDAALVNSGNVPAIADSASEDSETQEESEPASNDQIREMDSIVNAMEADVTARCDFFTRPNAYSETQEESESASNDQIREMDSIVNAMEADVTARCDFFTRPNGRIILTLV